MKKLLALLAFCIAIFGLLAVLVYGVFFAEDQKIVASPLVGRQAPEFNFTDIQTGKVYNLNSFKGKSVLLNIWASWCLACRTESKTLNDFYNQNKELVIVAIAVKDKKESALKFLNEYKKDYLVGMDIDDTVLINYGVTGVPETFLINADGTITEKIVGEVLPDMIPEISQELKLVY